MKSFQVFGRFLVLFGLVGFVVGCASTGMTNAEKTQAYSAFVKENKLEKVSRITTFRLHGWRYLNRDYVILSTSFNKPFLVEISGPCHELSFSHTIGIHHDGSSLNEKFDWVFAPSQPNVRCMIKSIHKLNREQADQLSRIGKASSQTEQTQDQKAKIEKTETK